MASRTEKAELLARLAATRSTIAGDLSDLGSALDVPRRVRSSFEQHPVAWVAGGFAVGMAVSSIFRRPRDGRKSLLSTLAGPLGFAGNRVLSLALPSLWKRAEDELVRILGQPRSSTETPSSPGE